MLQDTISPETGHQPTAANCGSCIYCFAEKKSGIRVKQLLNILEVSPSGRRCRQPQHLPVEKPEKVVEKAVHAPAGSCASADLISLNPTGLNPRRDDCTPANHQVVFGFASRDATTGYPARSVRGPSGWSAWG